MPVSAVERGRPTAPQMGASNFPLRGAKFSNYEGGVRVPAFLYGRGIPSGAEHHDLFHVTDIFPTLSGLAGAELPTDRVLDGVDQWSSIQQPGVAKPARNEIVLESEHSTLPSVPPPTCLPLAPI
eukprot:COSAG04_NODE_8413_length_979_cov_1.848864_1_plen_125_part_00